MGFGRVFIALPKRSLPLKRNPNLLTCFVLGRANSTWLCADMMSFEVDMKQFRKNWIWNENTVHYGERIEKTNGYFFTFDGDVYKRLLNEFCIFYTVS